MSSFDFEFPDDLVKVFEKVAKDDKLAEKLFDGVGDIIRDKMETECHKHDYTGELAKSIRASKVYEGKGGVKTVHVGPTGYSERKIKSLTKTGIMRADSVPNALKLIQLEYGNSHQPPRPMLDRIKREVNDKVVNKMQENLNKEVGDWN